MTKSSVFPALLFENLEENFIEWAAGEENIRAAVVIGSRARQDHPADEWSDLDILIFARDPEKYRADASWVEQMGSPWLSFIEPTPDGRGFERRVLYDGGLDVDYVPGSVSDLEQLFEREIPADDADMIRRGTRFLVDKEGFAQRLSNIIVSLQPYVPPAENEFLNLVNDFWYHTVWTAKKLRRGELWWGKSCCDSYLKNLLRQMMEWHARALQGAEVDTWMRGRFLEEWADPRAVAALPELFAHYDEADIWRALFATMNLFRLLAEETAQSLSYPYPCDGDRQSSALVNLMHSSAQS